MKNDRDEMSGTAYVELPKSKVYRQIKKALDEGMKKHVGKTITPELMVVISEELKKEHGSSFGLHDPSNCIEFMDEDGSEYAWSESNCRYELVARRLPDSTVRVVEPSFALIRKRLQTMEARVEQLLFEMKRGGTVPGNVAIAAQTLSMMVGPQDHGRGPGGA